MTGRELILYILQNHLEDQQIFANGKFLDFMTVKEAAAKFEVGETTVRVWVKMNMIPYISIGDEIFIPKTAPNPKTKETWSISDLAEALSKFI